MAEMVKDWDLTANRFVAFFDILGFKDLIAREKSEKIFELLRILSAIRYELDQYNNMALSKDAIFGET